MYLFLIESRQIAIKIKAPATKDKKRLSNCVKCPKQVKAELATQEAEHLQQLEANKMRETKSSAPIPPTELWEFSKHEAR